MALSDESLVVVGAGPAGLAVAACAKAAGFDPLVLERSPAVGAAWRRHYDRLHLHTNKGLSYLPGLKFPRTYPRYPSRQQVVDYLEAYASHHALRVELNRNVIRIAPGVAGWTIDHDAGTIRTRRVVVATGQTGAPVVPAWPGADSFTGSILHSSEYRNGEPYRGRRVLVVGFGNSGGEIALDLSEHGALPTLSVRGPVNIVPREILGIPVLAIGVFMAALPPRLADALAAPAQALRFGDYGSLGLQRSAKGPRRQMLEDKRVPLIDVGTVALIRRGGASVRPGIDRFEGRQVVFVDGSRAPFDAVIAATGYRSSVDQFLQAGPGVLDARGGPLTSGTESAAKSLFFSGFRVASTGMLREVGIEGRRIARDLARAANLTGRTGI